jgi:hypothetical protein
VTESTRPRSQKNGQSILIGGTTAYGDSNDLEGVRDRNSTLTIF